MGGAPAPRILPHMDGPTALLAHGPTASPRPSDPALTKVEILLPWFLAMSTMLPFALVVDGAVRWLAIGLAVGLGLGAGLSWYLQRSVVRRATAAIEHISAELRADADGRVAMVIRQFQWAVNDVGTLQQVLAASKEAARVAEDRARRAEHQVRLLELELYRFRAKSLRAGESALLAPTPDAGAQGERFAPPSSDLIRL